MAYADFYANRKSVFNRLRQKRFNFFLNKLNNLQKPYNILDIGGTVDFWEKRRLTNNSDFKITVLNLSRQKSKYKNIKVCLGNACDLHRFKTKSFDVAFSNSLIEHLGCYKNQESMAKEAKRVAKYYFIQTPNKYFPIEPHFLFPFFQFLPYKLKVVILTKTKLVRRQKYSKESAEAWIKDIELISRKKLNELFSGGKIYKETFFGMTKSLIVHNF